MYGRAAVSCSIQFPRRSWSIAPITVNNRSGSNELRVDIGEPRVNEHRRHLSADELIDKVWEDLLQLRLDCRVLWPMRHREPIEIGTDNHPTMFCHAPVLADRQLRCLDPFQNIL
jgi:hypothetical protein